MSVFSSTLLTFIRGILAHIPAVHWTIISILTLALIAFLLLRKKCPVYGAVASGITVFMSLLLLDVAVLIRYLAVTPHASGCNLTLDFFRFFRKSEQRVIESISNIIAFIPFSFFLFEFLASTKRFSAGRRLGLVTLAGFGLSLCIECLQLLLRVGFFELTDLVMNTLGAFVGAGVAALIRRFLHSLKRGRKDNKEIPSHCSE